MVGFLRYRSLDVLACPLLAFTYAHYSVKGGESFDCLSADPDVHALLWMAETIFDILGMGAAIEAAQRAIKYVLATGTTKAKTS